MTVHFVKRSWKCIFLLIWVKGVKVIKLELPLIIVALLGWNKGFTGSVCLRFITTVIVLHVKYVICRHLVVSWGIALAEYFIHVQQKSRLLGEHIHLSEIYQRRRALI